MKILVTGFDPFEKELVNPGFEAVKLLPDKIKDAQIIKVEIPTSFKRSAIKIAEVIEEHDPDVILSVGQAGGRTNITVEKVAINLMEARIPDNDEYSPSDIKVIEEGDVAYFTNLPIKVMIKKMRDNNIPAVISYTAGTFVCNCVMYNVLYLINKKYPEKKGGFIHVPYLPQQTLDKHTSPSMSAETIAKALELSIEAIVENQEDISLKTGAIM